MHTLKDWQAHRPLIDSSNLTINDFKNGVVVPCYHGTTHDFDTFDPSINGWNDGQFGAVNYFTTDYYDAHTNYLEDGADLKNRLEQVAESLLNQMEHDPEPFGMTPEDSDSFRDTADILAQEQLVGTNPKVLSLYVRIDNPFFLGGNEKWFVPNLSTFDDIQTDLDEDDFDDENAYQEAWEEAWDQAHLERYEFLQDVFEKAADILKYDGHIEIPPALLDDRYDGTSVDLERIILDHHSYLECYETGRLLSQALVGAVVQALGFDSIILLNADKRFRTMSMSNNTTHIHTFGIPQGTVKAIDNTLFDEKDTRF